MKINVEGRNDNTELLLVKTVENNKSPLEQWSESSLMVIELHDNGEIRFYHNGKHPMYLTNVGKRKYNNSVKYTAIKNGRETKET